MAKKRPPVSLDQMEDALGYKISVPKYAKYPRFYSDLTAVSSNLYERTKREYDEYLRIKRSGPIPMKSEQMSQAGIRYTVINDKCSVILECLDSVERYSFTADIYCDFDFHLPLQLTKDEASEAMFVAKLPRGNTYCLLSRFFNLPREVRDEIYTRAIPSVELQAVGSGDLRGVELARATGDPTGFYFPFRSVLGVLAVNRQMRNETLPLAYRKTSIHLDDMDDFISFAVSIGKVGRENVESIGFTWESPSDTECGEGDLTTEPCGIKLPKLHSVRCVQLLKGFARLKRLRLYFEDDLLSTLTLTDFKADQGICGLRSLTQIPKIEFLNQSGGPADQHQSIRWIKGEIESAKHGDGTGQRTTEKAHNDGFGLGGYLERWEQITKPDVIVNTDYNKAEVAIALTSFLGRICDTVTPLAPKILLRARSGTMPTKPGDKIYCDAMKWAVAQGIKVWGAAPSEVPGRGLGMRATRVIEEDEIIVTVPSSVMLTIDSVPKTFVELFPPETSTHGILAAYLSHGDASSLAKWKEWRETWPDFQFFKESMPVSWASEPQSASATYQNSGTRYHLLPPAASGSWNTGGVSARSFNPEAIYQNILPKQEKRLRSAWESVQHAFPGTDWNTFSYHWFIVNTRSFYYVTPGKDDPEDWNDAVGLVPIADYFNHANDPVSYSPGPTDITKQLTDKDREKACMATFDNKGYTISATRRIEEGEEVYIRYGTHPNDYLLVEYGFFLDYNESDAIFLDDLIFKDLSKPELELLRNLDLHGDYKVTQNGPCFRTQKVACMTFMNPKKWREYILHNSINRSDREIMTDIINGWVDTYLKESLSTIRTLEGMRATSPLTGTREPSGRVDMGLSTLLKRWSQIRDLCQATLNGTKMGRGGNGRG